MKRIRTEYNRQYYLKNKDKFLIEVKKYREQNSEKAKQSLKNSYSKYKEQRLQKSKLYYLQNRELKLKKARNYRLKNADKIKLSKKKYNSLNRKKINNWRNSKYKQDINFKIAMNLRNRINRVMRNKNIPRKDKHNIDYTSIINHLTNSLPSDINNKQYHIDHIIPLCSFDLSNPEELRKAIAPENHQWLTAEENLKKGKKILNNQKEVQQR